jgi:hypothetical protein
MGAGQARRRIRSTHRSPARALPRRWSASRLAYFCCEVIQRLSGLRSSCSIRLVSCSILPHTIARCGAPPAGNERAPGDKEGPREDTALRIVIFQRCSIETTFDILTRRYQVAVRHSHPPRSLGLDNQHPAPEPKDVGCHTRLSRGSTAKHGCRMDERRPACLHGG